jgi:hypothetical protein
VRYLLLGLLLLLSLLIGSLLLLLFGLVLGLLRLLLFGLLRLLFLLLSLRHACSSARRATDQGTAEGMTQAPTPTTHIALLRSMLHSDRTENRGL